MATAELQSSLTQFAAFARSLKGDEKGEAQTFLDHFFRALGHAGVIEAGATFEFRIAKKPGSAQLELEVGTPEAGLTEVGLPRRGNQGTPGGRSLPKGGKKYADLLWPDRVLIEMKSRGEHLEKHYDQAFNYWTHIVPKRPPYVILCNFDEFWIYDFNEQLFDPVDRLSLRNLAESASALSFLLPHPRAPIFDNNRVAVTRKAADLLAHVFRELVFRGIARDRAQRFILQLLVAVVSDDIGLLPDEIVTRTLKDCVEGQSSYDLLGGLFRQMNSEQRAEGGRFTHVDYFNGGLFAVIDPVELKHAELYRLHDAAHHNDWSQVKPEIFGTIFQASMDKEERHAFGAHFTSEFDIQKVVGPTIVRPWRERIEAASTLAELRTLLTELRRFRVLDPACGSGNFLYVAYREMKRLERTLLVRLRDKGEKPDRLVSAISLSQFFGIDVVPFAVELARVTLMLAKELELAEAKKTEEADGLLVFEKPLPLDNLERQIFCADALFADWPEADAIIGNPPYLGSRYLAKEHGYEYAQKVYARDPHVPKMADFCTHWFRKAHDALSSGGRAGLVGTNTIRQNESREASLDYIVENGGVITDAVSSQVWSGDAQVHVSIVNWEKHPASRIDPGSAGFQPAVSGIPAGHTGEGGGKNESARTPGPGKDAGTSGQDARAPLFPRESGASLFRLTLQRGDSVDSPWETFELPVINAALSLGTDVSEALTLGANQKPKVVYVGQYPFHEGFLLTPDEAAIMIHAEPKSREVLFPYMIGRDLVENGGPTRWSIDFGQNDVFFARGYPLAFERVKERVMPDVIAHAEAEKAKTGKTTTRWTRVAERWWQFRDYQPGTITAVKTVPRYIAVSRVTKRPIFEFVSSGIRPDNTIVVFPFADDYSFGILQSDMHWRWFNARCSTLGGTFRYTSDTVFDTFPWPQSPTREQIAEVAAAAVALRALRREIMGKLNYSLRDLYRTLEEPGANPLRNAHARLDTAVRDAYGMNPVAAVYDRRKLPGEKATDAHRAPLQAGPDQSDPLAFLLELNLACAAKEKAGEKIAPPGLPLPEAERAAFVTEDCVQVAQPGSLS